MQANFDAAITDGVFGVPTLAGDGEVFWGEDSTDMFEDWRRDRAAFEADEMVRVAGLPIGASRIAR